MSARLAACTPAVASFAPLPIQRAAMADIWSLGVSFANVIIRHKRLSHDMVERSCVLLVEHLHFAFVNADGPHSLLLRPFTAIASSGCSFGHIISSIISMNSSDDSARFEILSSWP